MVCYILRNSAHIFSHLFIFSLIRCEWCHSCIGPNERIIEYLENNHEISAYLQRYGIHFFQATKIGVLILDLLAR